MKLLNHGINNFLKRKVFMRNKCISISELVNIVTELLRSIEARVGTVIEIKKDSYWKITREEVYDMSIDTPKMEEIGSLYDNLEMISKFRKELKYCPTLSLSEIIPILKYIAEQVEAV